MKVAIILLLSIAWSTATAVLEDEDTRTLIQSILAQRRRLQTSMMLKEKSEKFPSFLVGASDPEINMTPAEIIEYWGYPVENYEVTTEDGYELMILRIPHGRDEVYNETTAGKRPVVFLQHGLDGSAADWVTNLPNEAAAFVFADGGFDVWIGNFRGNTYARYHTTLTTKDHAFWQFSWDEMAHYDLPAMINYALNISKADTLYYVGFSLGTTTAFAKFSQDLEFAKKIKKFYALAPMVTLKHIKGPLRWIAPFTGSIELVTKILGEDEFAPPQWLMDIVSKYFCSNPVSELLCSDVLFLIGGPESSQMNSSRIPVYLSHSPGGTSTRTMIHMGQMVKSGKFDAYDYGRRENKKHYGQSKPPEYDVSAMETPVFMFSGGQDWLADPKDVANLLPKIKNLFDSVYLSDFNDFDFIWGLRAAPEIYWPIRNDINLDFANSAA